jgi:hypothetical protein
MPLEIQDQYYNERNNRSGAPVIRKAIDKMIINKIIILYLDHYPRMDEITRMEHENRGSVFQAIPPCSEGNPTNNYLIKIQVETKVHDSAEKQVKLF